MLRQPGPQPENAFSKLKALLRKAAERTIDALWSTIGNLINLFTQTNAEITSPPQDIIQHDRIPL
jgi:hypothetical protein